MNARIDHKIIRTPEHVKSTERFWIVMSLDKPGPVERGERRYSRHLTEQLARQEARRLSASCSGGRFAVLAMTYVVGWTEVDFHDDLDGEIPF